MKLFFINFLSKNVNFLVLRGVLGNPLRDPLRDPPGGFFLLFTEEK